MVLLYSFSAGEILIDRRRLVPSLVSILLDSHSFEPFFSLLFVFELLLHCVQDIFKRRFLSLFNICYIYFYSFFYIYKMFVSFAFCFPLELKAIGRRYWLLIY